VEEMYRRRAPSSLAFATAFSKSVRPNQHLATECSVERAPAIEAIEKDRTVVFRLARWPAHHVAVFRP
jgi:hypothetical protein